MKQMNHYAVEYAETVVLTTDFDQGPKCGGEAGGMANKTYRLLRRGLSSAAILLSLICTAVAQSPLQDVAVGQFVNLRGEVIQTVQSGADFWLRVNITPDDYGIWRDTIVVRYHAVSTLQQRIPEKAIVEFQGWHRGTTSYKSVLGATHELPLVDACLLWDAGEALRFAPPNGCGYRSTALPNANANPSANLPPAPVGVPQDNESGGSYFVQISSQSSEVDATSAFRALQKRYPSLLLTRVPLVRRADTTEGIFYRTFVGPFQNWREANDLCEGFKKIGGQCVVAQFRDPRRPDIADEQNCQERKGYTSIFACTRKIDSRPDQKTLATAYRYRGAARIGERDYDGAIMDFTQAIALDGRDSLAYSQRGQVYLLKKDYASSLSDTNKALEIDPRNANALTQRSAVYSLTGERDKAVADANVALEIHPNASALKSNRGFAYNNIGEYDRAIVDLNDAIQLDPSNAFAYKNRGIAYEKKGEFRRALADYDTAMSLDKNIVEAIDGARRVKERIGN